jgi:uncharacterized protein YbjT (DUF2867 family)
MPELVVVIGGAGRTGRHVVAKLLARDVRVRVLSRRAGRMAGEGVEPVSGDVTDAGAVAVALDGADGAVVVVESGNDDRLPNGPQAVHHEGARHVVAGAAAGTHVVLVSQIYITRPDAYPAVAPTIAAREAAEEVLRASGLPATVVRPSWLTDAPGGQEALRLEQGDRGEGEVAREDVAEAVVQALLHPEARGRTFELYGVAGTPPDDWASVFGALEPDARAAGATRR